eukprot:gene30266-biopygen31550
MSGTHGAELVGEDPKGKRPMSENFLSREAVEDPTRKEPWHDNGGGSSCNRSGEQMAAGSREEVFEAEIGADGNFETCCVCTEDGLLICCEACPAAFHRECLGADTPPPDDDSAWFCPDCHRGFYALSA